MENAKAETGAKPVRRLVPPLRALFIWLVGLAFAPPVLAGDPSALCDAAAARAAATTGVPISVLRAISLTETGRKHDGAFRPWPWTVNMEGKGVWFDDPESARAYVFRNFERGARSFDVGCFQINYRWHGHNFASIDEMFQPEPNAIYAAKFLAELYREKGDWAAAAGAYHSRTREYADRYAKRFQRFRTAFLDQDGAPPPLSALRPAALPPGTSAVAAAAPTPALTPKVNRYPLLKAGTGGRGLGSLVPQTVAQRGMFAPLEADR